jgi:hypothetical protein
MGTAEYMVLGIFVLSGGMAVTAAVLDLDWYFQSRRAATFVHWLGRGGARLFYGLLGVALIVAGVLFYLYGYDR